MAQTIESSSNHTELNELFETLQQCPLVPNDIDDGTLLDVATEIMDHTEYFNCNKDNISDDYVDETFVVNYDNHNNEFTVVDHANDNKDYGYYDGLRDFETDEEYENETLDDGYECKEFNEDDESDNSDDDNDDRDGGDASQQEYYKRSRQFSYL